MTGGSAGGSLRSIWERDKRRCWICGHGVALPDASRDHVQPRSTGGYDKSRNYRLAHRRCNNARGTLSPEAVRAVRESLPTMASAELVRQALLARRKQ